MNQTWYFLTAKKGEIDFVQEKIESKISFLSRSNNAGLAFFYQKKTPTITYAKKVDYPYWITICCGAKIKQKYGVFYCSHCRKTDPKREKKFVHSTVEKEFDSEFLIPAKLAIPRFFEVWKNFSLDRIKRGLGLKRDISNFDPKAFPKQFKFSLGADGFWRCENINALTRYYNIRPLPNSGIRSIRELSYKINSH